MISGVSAWAIMYGLNQSGLNNASASIQMQSVANIISVIRDFNTPFVYGVQVMEEILRAKERETPGFVKNVSNWISTAFVLAKQFGGACVCGFPDGSLHGFRSELNGTVLRLIANGDGDLIAYRANEFGEPLFAVSTESGYNASLTSWFAGSKMRAGFFQTDVRSIAGTDGVGITYSIALMSDLLPPLFSIGRAPLSPRMSSKSREVLAVCSMDGKLSDLSARLSSRRVGTSGHALVFFFTGSGIFAGSSNSSIPVTDENQNPVIMTKVDNQLINETMEFLLTRNGIPRLDFARYREFDLEENIYVTLAGEARICSIALYVNADNTTSFFAVLVTPSSDYFAAADRANLIALLVIFLCVVPVLVLLTSICMHYSLSKPANLLAMAMYSIAQNFDFDHVSRTSFSRIKEMEVMQRSFDGMQTALKAFSMFTPREVVRGLLKRTRRADVGVEEVFATAQFSDIEGFTSISESVSPQKLIIAMEEYFDKMTAIIESCEGTVGDLIGDCIFSFFNAPAPIGPRHAFLCVESALKMQEVLIELREDWKSRGLPEFRVRMGINSGKCLAGNVGSRSRLKFTLLGDEINLASRLEGLCKQYGCYIAISDSTFSSVGVADGFCCRVLDRVAVVGKKSATIVREVLARRSEATADQLLLESLSNQMLASLVAGDIATCGEILESMDKLKPNDLAILKLMVRVEKWKRMGEDSWSNVEFLVEK